MPPCHHLLCFNNPPHPPAPSVIILQSSKLRRLFSLANLLKGPFFSQNYTEEQNSQRPTETLSQPMTQSISANVKGSGPSPNPSPAGKGRDHRDTPIMRLYASFYLLISSPIGVTSHTTPLPCGGGVGRGAALSCSPFFSHRTTQKNRNHKGAQRY